ncbi:DMT family transporter [Leucobacter sp. GX24907]
MTTPQTPAEGAAPAGPAAPQNAAPKAPAVVPAADASAAADAADAADAPAVGPDVVAPSGAVTIPAAADSTTDTVTWRGVSRGTIARAALLAGALFLSVSGIMVKLAGVDAATTAVLRCAIAALVLIPFAFGERSRKGALSTRGIIWAVAAGVALGIDYAAWTASIFLVGAGISAVLVNLQVVVLPLLALAIDGERMTRRYLLALPVMLIGISLVGGLWDGLELGSGALSGTALAVLAGVSYSVYLFVARRVTRREPGLVIQPLTWAMGAAAVTATIIAPFTGGIHLSGISAESWGWIIAMAVGGQVLAWALIQYGSAQVPATVASGLLLVQPILALVLAAPILQEFPSWLQWLGAAIVIAAIAAASGVWPRRARRGMAV